MNGYDEFTLDEKHVKLLRAANVSWDTCEFGAPGIDPKRPYGNSSVHLDMAEVLGVEGFTDHEGTKHFSSEEIAHMDRLHRELKTALQVVLATGSFEPGTYCAPKYTSRYVRTSAGIA